MFTDFRYAIRVLRKSPGFTSGALLILALGIGAGTAIFTAVNAVLLRPLPYAEPDRLVSLCETNAAVAGFCVGSPPDVMDWSASSRTLESVGFARSWLFLLRSGDQSQGVDGGYATAGWFRALRVTPALGRLIEEGDQVPGSHRVAVLTHGLWVERFGGDAGVLSQSITLDGEPYTVIGVLPADFVAPELDMVRMWTPPPWDPRDEERRDWRGFQVVGRLSAGSTLTQAKSELSAVQANLARAHPQTNEGWGVEVKPLVDQIVGSVRPVFLVFSGAVTLLLAIACANLANLMLVRATDRRREMAIRTAAGASRGSLIRQLLAESLLLSLAGGALGLLLADWLTQVFVRLAPAGIPRLTDTRVDLAAFGFALGLAVVTALAFGLAPALWATRVDLSRGLREGMGSGRSASGVGLRRMLVTGEVALTLVLLVGGGLLARSFEKLVRWDPGFDRSNVLTLSAFTSAERHAGAARLGAFWRDIEQSVAGLPGVRAVSTASAGPVFGGVEPGRFAIVGDPTPESPPTLRWYDASPGYFATLGVRVLRGRDLSESDGPGAPVVGVVNETLARRFFPAGDALGRRLRMLDMDLELEIVGVVADVTPFLAGQPIEPQVWWSNRQLPRLASFVVVRTTADPAALAPAIRQRIEAVDREIQLGTPVTLDGRVDQRLIGPRFQLSMVGVLGLVALILAVAGVYSVLAYAVAMRRREMGIRLALGARRASVVGRVMREGATMAGAGLGIGLLGAVLLTRFLERLLHGVAPTDAPTFLVTGGAMMLAAMLACAVPALRAARVDPSKVLREE
jgi:putative ABC transport system permease protein